MKQVPLLAAETRLLMRHVSELQDLGVARVSYGSGFLKALGGARRMTQEILEKGTVSSLNEGVQTPEINALVGSKKAI
jgi:2-methylisocitrate lyase-like PEP mutase family enzyme